MSESQNEMQGEDSKNLSKHRDAKPLSPKDDSPPKPKPQPVQMPNDERENMDVHHSSHSTKKEKHFAHYFFDFFMLFLAVTAGFFVENLREHYVEVNHEEEYIN